MLGEETNAFFNCHLNNVNCDIVYNTNPSESLICGSDKFQLCKIKIQSKYRNDFFYITIY